MTMADDDVFADDPACNSITLWQFNEAVALLNAASAYVRHPHTNEGLADEIDEALPLMREVLHGAVEAKDGGRKVYDGPVYGPDSGTAPPRPGSSVQ